MNARPIQVLLIEDDPDDVLLLKEAIAAGSAGQLRVTHADRLSTGLERIGEGPCDVVLLDLNLPDSQGLDTLTRLCTQAPRVPVVVLSGLGDEAIVNEAVTRGAQDYLVKGEVSGVLLVRVLRYAIERKRAGEELRESEERYHSVVTAMAEGIVLQDTSGVIHAWNASAERILGLSADQMMGLTSVDPRWRAIHEDGSRFPGETHPAMMTLRTGRRCSGIIMGVHKPDGTLTWVSINSEPLLHPGETKPYAVVMS